MDPVHAYNALWRPSGRLREKKVHFRNQCPGSLDFSDLFVPGIPTNDANCNSFAAPVQVALNEILPVPPEAKCDLVAEIGLAAIARKCFRISI